MSNFQDNYLMGTALDAFASIYYKKTSVGSVFFKPFESKSDFFYNAATIVTAPVVATSLSAGFVLAATNELLKSLGNLLILAPNDAYENFKESVAYLGYALALILLAASSPFINLIDGIGSGITSLNSAP